jgi:hypothetical protein
MLWPVFIAIAGHFVVVLGPLMSRAYDGNVSAGVALGVLGILSLHLGRLFASRGFRPVAVMLLLTWVASVPVAWLSVTYNIF